jgi:hypothetical protein
MKWSHVIWDHLPDGNVEHVEEHDLTTEEVEHVLENYESTGYSQSSGRPCVFGHVPDGRRIMAGESLSSMKRRIQLPSFRSRLTRSKG